MFLSFHLLPPDFLLYLSLLAAPYPFIENNHSPKAIRRFTDKAGFCHFSPLPLSLISLPGADMTVTSMDATRLFCLLFLMLPSVARCGKVLLGGQCFVYCSLEPRQSMHRSGLPVIRGLPAETYRTPVPVGECLFCTTEPETACLCSFPESL